MQEPTAVDSHKTFAELDLLALLLASTEQGFWFIDNELLTTDANPAMCRVLRVTREQMIGRSIYDFVDEANAAIFRHHVALRAQGVAEGYEIALKRSDGTLVDCYNNATPVVDASGRKVGAIGLFSDISAQKSDQRQLKLTSELLAQKSQVLERTLESLAQGVVSVDPSGHVNAWNHRLLELLGLPEQLLASRPTLNQIVDYLIAAGQLDTEAHEHAEASPGLSSAEPSPLSRWRGACRRQTSDGRVLAVDSFGAPDGGIVRTYTDVTESVRAEEALVAAKEEAERASRAKSEFLSRMSHELRTPLNAILGFGQLLANDAEEPLSQRQRQRVNEVLRGAHHLLELINEVLDLARIEAGALRLQLAPVAVAPLVQECLRMVAPAAAARDLRIRHQSARDIPADAHVRADPTRFRQVLLNLLTNAIKYNRQAGLVQVSAEQRPGVLRVSVQDEGPGLSAAQQQRLFQAFERLGANTSNVEGTGIGLALSRQLVSLMNGQIGVDSREGEGSSFWVELPLADPADVAADGVAAPASMPRPPRNGHRHRVLYIEDNEVNQLLMAGMLARRPALELGQATDPLQGLALAQEQAPDLVLLDIQLPGIDGFEVLRRLRAYPGTARVPVVAVSANAMRSDLEAAESAGFDAYLTKPLDMQRLLETVDRFIGASSA
jgi:PAS domain S-box-containing protein